jgi:Zn/Cd-binding protein ZinT
MKTIKRLSPIALTLILFLTSCTLEKRVYMSGYHIEWKNEKQNLHKNDLAKKEAKKTDEKRFETIEQSDIESNSAHNNRFQISTEDNIIASTNNTILPSINKNKMDFVKKSESKKYKYVEECDILTMRNGDEIMVKVLEVGTSEIKYKKCDFPDGPTIIVRKSKVFSIKYSNGTKDVISEPTPAFLETTNITDPKGEKSLIITLILFIFLGFFGAHRFYLGHIGIGVLYLFTGALCGVGLLIDLVLLLTGRLKPRNGDFYDGF